MKQVLVVMISSLLLLTVVGAVKPVNSTEDKFGVEWNQRFDAIKDRVHRNMNQMKNTFAAIEDNATFPFYNNTNNSNTANDAVNKWLFDQTVNKWLTDGNQTVAEDNLTLGQNTIQLPFQQVNVSVPRRTERGAELYRIQDTHTAHFEAYMGQQPTTGYNANITNVTLFNNTVTIDVAFYRPGPNEPVAQEITYPADAVEFQLPNGDYTVTINLQETETSRQQLSIQ